MGEPRNKNTPLEEPTNEKKFFIKPTYQRTFYCKNCGNESIFDIVKGVEIIIEKDGTIFERDYNGDIKLFECKTCGSSKHLYERVG
jgi:hypothetical protein